MNINLNRAAYIFSIILSVLIIASVIATNSFLFFALVAIGFVFITIVAIDALRTQLEVRE